MWHRRHLWHMRFGFPPFGFFYYGPRPFPSREEQLEMLQEYKKELEKELKNIEKEIEELKKGS